VGADPDAGVRVGAPVGVAGDVVVAAGVIDARAGVGVSPAAGTWVGAPVGVVDGVANGVGAGGDPGGAAAHWVSIGEQTIMETHLQPEGGGGDAWACDAAVSCTARVAADAASLEPACRRPSTSSYLLANLKCTADRNTRRPLYNECGFASLIRRWGL